MAVQHGIKNHNDCSFVSEPSMTEASLYDLLKDMLKLQAEVFTCISEDVCHQVMLQYRFCRELEQAERKRERENSISNLLGIICSAITTHRFLSRCHVDLY